MKKFLRLPDRLILGSRVAFLGEIYHEIRAIALGITESRKLIIRYYLDREPNDFDQESIEVVETNLSATVGDEYDSVELECIFFQGLQRDMDELSGFIYGRREYEMEDNTLWQFDD